MAGSERWRRRAAVGLGLALLAGAVALAVLRAGRPPEGPVAVPLDAVACARCRMLVSDASFAAQLHAADGRVLFFDDPGCMLLHLGDADAPVHAAWFHHLREDRWIPRDAAGFVPVPRSPMGYGLGAVEAAQTPGALSAAQATARLRDRGPAPEAGP